MRVHVGANASGARPVHERANGAEVLVVINISASFRGRTLTLQITNISPFLSRRKKVHNSDTICLLRGWRRRRPSDDRESDRPVP